MPQSTQTSAEILSKTADYVKALEEKLHTLQEAQNAVKEASIQEEAEKLAEALHQATGTEVDLSVAKKIAKTEDEDVKELISKLASVEEVESIGNAKRRSDPTKTAGALEPTDEAEAEFARWILS